MATDPVLPTSAAEQMALRQYWALRSVIDGGFSVDRMIRLAGSTRTRFYTYVPQPKGECIPGDFEVMPANEWTLLDSGLAQLDIYTLRAIGLPANTAIVRTVDDFELNDSLVDEAEDLHEAAVVMRSAEKADNPAAALTAARNAQEVGRRAELEALRQLAQARHGRGQVEGIILAMGGDGR